MARKRSRRQPKSENQQEQKRQEADIDDATEFGLSLMCLFLTGFFVFCALYLGPYPDLTILGLTIPLSSLIKWVCYILAAICFVFAPEMGNFFKAIWGGGERGWKYSAQTVVFIVLSFSIHLLAVLLFHLSETVGWLSWLRYITWAVQVPVIVFALFAAVMLGYACDAFFIKPILEKTSQGGAPYQSLVGNVRKRVFPRIVLIGN